MLVKNGFEFSNTDIEFSTIKYLALSNVRNKCIDYVGIGDLENELSEIQKNKYANNKN